MTISGLQKWVDDDWKNNSKLQPSIELQLLYIIEELGEVAEAIRKSQGAKDREQLAVDLGSEIADLAISIVTLANGFEINLEKEILAFQHRLAERHSEGF